MARRPEPPPRLLSMLNKFSYEGPETIVKALFHLGCFNHVPTCPGCGSPVRLEVFTTRKKVKGEVREYASATLRRCKTSCHSPISLVENTLWKKVRDRTLFIFTVDGFVNRWTTTSIAQSGQSLERTVSKYLRLIKNALHLEVEETKRRLFLEGRTRVQIDESHVFTRKYSVGRVLATTTQGWVFGVVEDK